MSLEDQLRGDVSGANSARLNERLTVTPAEVADPLSADERPASPGGSRDPYGELKSRVHQACIPRLGPRLFNAEATSEVREEVRRAVTEELAREKTPLSTVDRERLVREITADVLGYGPLEPFLRDESVTEVMVNGFDRIYVERAGKIEPTDAAFVDESHLYRIIDRIVSQIGRRVDEASPMVDARLPDGSRVNAIIPPLSLNGPSVTIRKFSRDPYTMADLIGFGTLTPKAASFVEACVRGKLNVLISGGTGTGKTTTLNALSAYIPEDERIITIEDAAELQLQQPHVVRLESRPANIEGQGEIRIRDLVRNALRMRPDRIVVGEVRGAETLDMLQAMNTGHEGSLTTIHANSPRDALNRLETLVLMAGLDLPLHAIREQISSALDLVIHLTRLVDGTRRVSHVTEVLRMESDVITLQDVFVARPLDERAAANDPYTLLRPLGCTGLQPHFQAKLSANGVHLPSDFYEPEDFFLAPLEVETSGNGNGNGNGGSR
jgi:pilus assembly protein CpaF